ncbi:MAG: succinate dehydrogenase, cytochrome b556 subunit [Neisseriaceae bacterium]|nr:succinate dehydrogenase, cytochrome b556 subunit [Neisseriaceae bacterium]MBR5676046.1 succinate dehydrogenase, cytochrome b556 subunit [Neisseriaceae bacterium]MBR5940014.1 succinate dehydrogenase, cytochrome b556 subunit [Neisseriaceae bacterium]
MKKQIKYIDVPYLAPRMSVTAIVSILHRITGVALFACLPIILWLFSGSLNSEEGFDLYQSIVGNPLVKLILIGLLWAYLHHAFAGIRFLLLDLHKGLEAKTAQKTAKIVAIAAPIVALIMGVILW